MKFFSTLFFFIIALSIQAQDKNKDILFTVDDDPVYASEFIRVFNKNLDLVKDESQKNIDEYLKLFVDYKLKLKEAKTLGLDTLPRYTRELKSYKTQLAKNYVTDNKVTDALVEEAYNRVSNEVNASHILIKLNENASPKDTLEVYNKLLKLRDRVINEGFKPVQKEIHNGKTTYAEDLGYFTGFKMVYEFENAAYNTPKGEVSLPFKTQFGYHIVLIHDKRQSRGQREVAHIMVALDKENAENRIQDIYKKLDQGEEFKSLAKQFSEDKSSANKGGKLQAFSSGELRSPEFEKKAFAISKEEEYTKPFKSNFGWHIVKLIKKIEIPAFEEMKPTLEAKVQRDSRSKLISTSRTNNLKEQYTISNVEKDLTYFTSILNTDFYNGKWSIPKNMQSEKPFVKIENKQFTYADFASFLNKKQHRKAQQLPFKKIVDNTYKDFLDANLIAYQEDNLENENEDFANILNEYRDGLLLFDLMDKKIWKAAVNDTLAVQEYYNANKENYFFKERVDAIVASSAKKKDIAKVSKLLEKGNSVEEIKQTVNTNNQVKVIFTTGLMDANHQLIPENFIFKKGISKIYNHNNSYVVIKVANILPKTNKTLKEAKGKVASDFQNSKEKIWLAQLAKKYTVKINPEVLKTIKTKLNK